LTYKVVLSRPAKQYLKKLKSKPLKSRFLTLIYDDIAENPSKGNLKQGALAGIYTRKITFQKNQYRLAYVCRDQNIIVFLLIGNHENFYQQLRKYIDQF